MTVKRESILHPADKELAVLKRDHPLWRIWFVPTLQQGGDTLIKWCAQPLPLLNCDSPGELRAEMRAAETWRAGLQPGTEPDRAGE